MCVSSTSDAQMLGSRVRLETFYPSFDSQTSTRPVRTVSSSVIEFPHLYQFDKSPPGSYLIDDDIDFGDSTITFTYDRTNGGSYASSPVNTYVFTDLDDTMPDFTGLSIDTSVTTLAIQPSALRFTKNKLFINVSGLSFNSNTVARFKVSFAREYSKLANLSTRVLVSSGDDLLIGGFIVTGNQPKNIIIRAIGPSLPVAGALPDPVLELHDSTGGVIATNDNWVDSADKQAIIDSGIPPANDKEAAIVKLLNPGNYTAAVRGNGGAAGVGLVEVYDVDPASSNTDGISRLANISTRGLVQPGDRVMIGGLIVTGPHGVNAAVRALGPSLASSGVQNPLEDPMLELHDKNGALVAANDDWQSDTRAKDLKATGVAPSDAREAGVVRALAPGAYTAIVRGKGSAIGTGLVEVYRLSN
jgi:hypothetical protein